MSKNLKSILARWSWSLFLMVSFGSTLLATEAEQSRLKVLFLGDQGHHRPSQRALQLIPVMDRVGIDVTYTENLGYLSAESLRKFDALLVYANIDQLDNESAQAILDYVAGGGGYVPVHCASYCFRNQPKLVELCGAQFQRHGTGDFATKIESAEHPITDGLMSFVTWDETYEHHLHYPKDRIVLQSREDAGKSEPWTWVRTHGKGRVFYTAYGHDHRTWENPGFHALLERGIRWAAGADGVFDSIAKPRAITKPYEFAHDDGMGLPDYRHKPGAKETIHEIQKPLKPTDAIDRVSVPRGFHAELFAAEPEIGKPLCTTWDERGRLWIAETVDYPNDLKPRGKGRDRIKICEDTNGDGRADKFTVFAEGLSIPTGMVVVDGGLIVHQAPDTLKLNDRDGDDHCESTDVLFSGWGTFDTHAGPSNLRYGHDNWLYTIVGYSGFRGVVGGQRHEFGQGIVRFKADGSKLEFIRSTNNNSWGLGFSEEGFLFGSTANGCPSVYAPIANRHYEQVRGWSSTVLDNIAPGYRFYPITENVRQVDFFGGFTAAAGHALYTARTYPKAYWNKTAFVAEPTGHLVATMDLVKNGTDFSANYGGNLVASDDQWCAPIAAEVGPDGNVWVSDWYNIIVQHNPTPNGFKTGSRGAYETPLRDTVHGRIYRIVPDDFKSSSESFNLAASKQDSAQLITALKASNMLWRLHAQRLLVERGKMDVVPALVKLVADSSMDDVGLNVGAIHALWALRGLSEGAGLPSEADAAWLAGVKHPSAAVRRTAALAMPVGAESTKRIVDSGLLQDGEPHVRLAAMLALADGTSDRAAGPAILAGLLDAKTIEDRWLPDSVTSAAAKNDVAFLIACSKQQSEAKISDKGLAVIERVAQHLARSGNSDALGALLVSLGETRGDIAAAILGGVSNGLGQQQNLKLSAELENSLVKLFNSSNAKGKLRVIALAQRLGSQQLNSRADELATSLLELAKNVDTELAQRISAVKDLASIRRDDAQTAERLVELIDGRQPAEFVDAVVQSLKGSTASGLGAKLAQSIVRLTPKLRPIVLGVMLVRIDWCSDLLDCFEAGSLDIADLPLDRKQSLAAHPNAKIAGRAKELLKRTGGLPNADRQAVIDQYAPVVLNGGNAQRGKVLFKSQCATCHIHGGEGNKVGPDLTGMAAHPKLELLTHILDPSRSVEGNFLTYTVLTVDGLVVSGIMANESRTSVEILDATAKRHTLQRSDIEEINVSRKSTMPEGFEKQLDPAAMADLLEFLAARGKYFPLDLRKVATTISTKDMFFEGNGQQERLVFPDWSPKSFEGIPFHLVDPNEDRVPNVVMLYGTEGVSPPKMPKSIELPINSSAAAIHMLSGISGWGYLGGAPSRSLTMTVRLKYADGTSEDHALLDGVHFADYINADIKVPESKLAFRLRGQQVRYLKITPKKAEPIERVEFIKGSNHTAPIIVAVTVESRE